MDFCSVEDEQGVSARHFPRNYKEIFEALGLRQVEENHCTGAGLSTKFRIRVFKKIE